MIRVFSLALLIACSCAITFAQATAAASQPNANIDEKSQEIINHAIEVLGGSNYLNAKTVIGKGLYTSFVDGASQLPSKFLDYIVYPDGERTEFTSMGIKTIQTNSGNGGWIFDGSVKKISDQTPQQVDDFKRALRTSVENLLRGWWQKDGAHVKYVGRREAGVGKRNETVRLTYPDGFWIEYEFGARDGLPAKVIYKRSRKNPDTDEVVETDEEDHLLKPITIDGITAPWVIDHFTHGQQTSRVAYDSIQYNQKIPDSVFAKPDDVKKLK